MPQLKFGPGGGRGANFSKPFIPNPCGKFTEVVVFVPVLIIANCLPISTDCTIEDVLLACLQANTLTPSL